MEIYCSDRRKCSFDKTIEDIILLACTYFISLTRVIARTLLSFDMTCSVSHSFCLPFYSYFVEVPFIIMIKTTNIDGKIRQVFLRGIKIHIFQTCLSLCTFL